MRKIIVLEHISLDGVIQGPGGKDENPGGGYDISGYAGLWKTSMIRGAVALH